MMLDWLIPDVRKSTINLLFKVYTPYFLDMGYIHINIGMIVILGKM